MAVKAPPAPAEQQAQQGAAIPFIFATDHDYEEPPFDTYTVTLDGNPHERVIEITPGNFLKGVRLRVKSANGVLGSTAALVQDAPYSIFSSITFEDIGGQPILNAMGGFAYAMKVKWLEPWRGDPALKSDYQNTINPCFTLHVSVELRNTAAVLSNTDARSQFRLRYTIAPLVQSAGSPNGLVDVGTGVTAPDVTVETSVVAYSSVDAVDLSGRGIAPLPAGLPITRLLQHEPQQITGGNNRVRHTLVGTEIRGILWIVRDSTATRIDLTDANAGTVEFRLDNRRKWKKLPSQWVDCMERQYPDLRNDTWGREDGVYAIPFFRQLGDDCGDYWLQTVEQNDLNAELQGADIGSNTPGTIEIIYDQLAAPDSLPGEFEGL